MDAHFFALVSCFCLGLWQVLDRMYYGSDEPSSDGVGMTIDERIAALEKKTGTDFTPGTELGRTQFQDGHFGWTLAVGRMSLPKRFITGDSIEEVLEKAEALWK